MHFTVLGKGLRHQSHAFGSAKDLTHIFLIGKGKHTVFTWRMPISLSSTHQQLLSGAFALPQLNRLQLAIISSLNRRCMSRQKLLVLILNHNKQIIGVTVRQPVTPKLGSNSLLCCQLQRHLRQKRVSGSGHIAAENYAAAGQALHHPFYLHVFTSFLQTYYYIIAFFCYK